MPQTSDKDQTENPPSTFGAWWRRFHFSGRVIMCSVLFGLGLILIGGLLFAINTDDENKPENEGYPSEVPTKAPSNYVGPVVMGVGGFVVIIGVTMCLFETHVCRKRTADSSPLISERADPECKDSEPTAVPSMTHDHRTHRREKRKPSASPKRSKGHSHKSRSKERNKQKAHSPKSPPISIEAPKSFLTSSEDTFLTPPNTLKANTVLTHSTSRDAENQTSSSLMKSFTSSGPSWTQSTEFQTPSTSFGDQSMSLENSIEIDEKQAPENVMTTELTQKSFISAGFLTPIPLEEEKIQEMSSKVQNQKNELQKSFNTGTTLNVNEVSETAAASGALDTKSNKPKILDDESKQVLENNQVIKGNQISTLDNELVKKDVNQVRDTELININNLMETGKNDEASSQVSHISASDFEARKLSLTKNDPNEVSDLETKISDAPENEHKELTSVIDTDKKTHKNVTHKWDIQDTLQSSTSSNETVISQNTSLEEQLKEIELTTEETADDKPAIFEKAELSIDDVATMKDVLHEQGAQSGKSIENETSAHVEANLCQISDIQVEENKEKPKKENSS